MKKDKQNSLTKKITSAFTKKYGRTAVEGAEPTFNVSKTYGGTIPYLPGKFREEYSKEKDDLGVDHPETKKSGNKTNNKVQDKTNSKANTNKQNKSK